MNNPLGVSPSKGKQGTTRGKEKIFLPRWEFDSHRGKKIFSLPRVVPCFPLLGLTPSGLFMGLSSTIIYTSELILCSTIHVLLAVINVWAACDFRSYILTPLEGLTAFPSLTHAPSFFPSCKREWRLRCLST